MIDIEKLIHVFRYDAESPMVFNSGLFLFLFPLFVVCYYLLRERKQWRIIYVLAFSYFFYYKSSGLFLGLLLGVSVVDYWLGYAIYCSRQQTVRRLWVLVSVVVNIGMLGYFKYADFFREMWCEFTGTEFLPFALILPVGISFFTFQSLSYTIDIYRREVEPLRRFADYAFFVSFFPQLVAGPIVRARDFIPQMQDKVIVTREMFGRGIFLILTGVFKKAVISDYISINFVDRIFDTPQLFSGVENLMAVYGYALQIYCDFSGYSDMAIGIALLLGFRFKMNFNSPYKAQSITEFWKRWHISLSTWLRDYLYIPLGGNRKGEWRMYANLMVTMLIGGLWHGASWRFVFWGGWHGLWLMLERLQKQGRLRQMAHGAGTIVRKVRIPALSALSGHKVIQQAGAAAKIMVGYVKRSAGYVHGIWNRSAFLRCLVRTLVTFHLVCFGWIFFRADSFASAWAVVRQIFFHFRGELFLQWLASYSGVAALMLLGYITHFLPDWVENWSAARLVRSPLAVKVALLVIVVFIVMQIKSSEILPFIYFQF